MARVVSDERVLLVTLIRFDKEIVSLAKRPLNIEAVSAYFTTEVLVDTDAFTNAVVATELSLLLVMGVGALGFPVSKGEVSVLLVKTSMPFKVDKVPETGNIILLLAVVVRVRSPTPPTVTLPLKVMVLLTLATPVPPLEPGKIPIIDLAESATDALLA